MGLVTKRSESEMTGPAAATAGELAEALATLTDGTSGVVFLELKAAGEPTAISISNSSVL